MLFLLGSILSRIFFSFGRGVLRRLRVSFCDCLRAILTWVLFPFVGCGETIEVWNINFWRGFEGYVGVVAIVL